MNDYVKREDVINKCIDSAKLCEYINEIPSADVVSREDYEGLELRCKNFEEALKELDEKLDEVEQKKGEWERNDDGFVFWWECSECHHDAWYDREDLNYCPYCGAKMVVNDEC